MAIYCFQCLKCGKVTDVNAPMSKIPQEEEIRCKKCGAEVKKIITLPNLLGFDELGRSGR